MVIVHATRKLLYYFQAHTVVILTQFPPELYYEVLILQEEW